MQSDDSEVVTAPLPAALLAQRWRELVDDPRYADLAGRLELDAWGKITMTPVSTRHADMAGRLAALLLYSLGGHALPEVGIATAEGVYAPDVAWCSDAFWAEHNDETPLLAAPEVCIEIALPSNTQRDLERKLHAYRAAGAIEVWIVYARSKRIEFHDKSGRIERTSFRVDLSGLFG